MNDRDWYTEDFRGVLRFGLAVRERLWSGRSAFQEIEVLDTDAFGRVLVLDGIFQTSERDEHVYHEMLVHPALCTAPDVRRVLVIGGGDGGTVREVLRHPGVERVVQVEIDADVVEVSKRFLPSIGGTAWDDSRLDLRIGDGVAFVRDGDSPPFDVIVLDGSDPIGPSSGLFDHAFYRDCARALTPNGVFVAQTESPFLHRELYGEIVGALRSAFGHAASCFAPVPLYSAGPWSFTLASGEPVPGPIVAARADAVAPACRYWNPRLHDAAFVEPNDVPRPPAPQD